MCVRNWVLKVFGVQSALVKCSWSWISCCFGPFLRAQPSGPNARVDSCRPIFESSALGTERLGRYLQAFFGDLSGRDQSLSTNRILASLKYYYKLRAWAVGSSRWGHLFGVLSGRVLPLRVPFWSTQRTGPHAEVTGVLQEVGRSRSTKIFESFCQFFVTLIPPETWSAVFFTSECESGGYVSRGVKRSRCRKL